MADAIPNQIEERPAAHFQQWVADALKSCREVGFLGLAASPLAASALVQRCLLAGEADDGVTRSRLLKIVLRWGIDRLRPGGAPDWLAADWRAYLLLHHYYFLRQTSQALIEQFHITPPTFQLWRRQAVAALSSLLQRELSQPQHTMALWQTALAERYAALTKAEQELLRRLALFRHPVIRSWVTADANLAELSQPQLSALLAGGWLEPTASDGMLAIPLPLRTWLHTLLTAKERSGWHTQAAQLYQAASDPLEAAWHWRSAGAVETAAQLLLTQQQTLLAQGQGAALRTLVAEFQRQSVQEQTWGELTLLAGTLAEMENDLCAALLAYQQAFGSTHRLTKAQAAHRCAKLLELQNIDEAVAYYGYTIQLFQRAAPAAAQLVQVYIDFAWIYIQIRPDFPQAAAQLQQAEQTLQRYHPQERALWADWHNANSRLCHAQGNIRAGLNQRHQAWLAATECQDQERMMMLAHNLGQDYATVGEYEQAQHYVHRGLTLAQQAGNQKWATLCHKTLGTCAFGLGQYEAAIAYYQQAATRFAESSNQSLHTYLCYDLAEAYIASQQITAARLWFERGVMQAKTLGLTQILAEFDRLAQQQPLLAKPDVAREHRWRALVCPYLQNQDALTNRTYRLLAGLSHQQAVRDLSAWVAAGLLVQQGKGRAVQYRAAPSSAFLQLDHITV